MHKKDIFPLLFLQSKCANNSNQKGDNYIENNIFVNVKNPYTRVSKKPVGRKSPITTSGLSALQQRRNSSNLDSRTPQQCVVVVSDWLRQFQQDVPIDAPTPMEDSTSEETPSTSTSPASPQSQEHEEESMRPPSVSSSVSAPLSPAASTYSQGASSSTSQDDHPDVSSYTTNLSSCNILFYLLSTSDKLFEIKEKFIILNYRQLVFLQHLINYLR